MRYAQFDYHPTKEPSTSGEMREWWTSHWNERKSWRDDLRDEPLWVTIEDVFSQTGVILEAGCGPGQWVHFFDHLGHTTIGVDYASATLQRSKRLKPNLRLASGDFCSLPFENDSFDYIYSGGAIEHDVRGPEAALWEFRRVLKPEGRLMCSVPCLNIERMVCLPWFFLRDWLKQREVLRRLAGKTAPFLFHEYLYSPRTYKTILEKCGFEVLALRGYGQSSGGSVTMSLGRAFCKFLPLYNAHMVMAICRKASVDRKVH